MAIKVEVVIDKNKEEVLEAIREALRDHFYECDYTLFVTESEE